MAGIVKRKYFAETQRIQKEFTKPLSLIALALPSEYNKYTILDLYKQFYPLEWEKLTQRYDFYTAKDKHLQEVGKKKRYYHDEPQIFFFKLAKIKHLLSKGQQLKHKAGYSHVKREQALYDLNRSRDLKVKKHREKTNIVKNKMQIVEPLYLDVFIVAYHKAGVTTRDKIEIFNELKKYECQKTTEFFHKLNDSERNNQIRRMAFEHLQKIGVFVRLRKNFKGKSKSYMTEQDPFNVTPKDLVTRIEKNSIQSKKSYDVFISHSYIDSQLVINVKNELNSKNISVYCDWTSDNDFLKRSLASEFTEVVLKRRIDQSSHVLFLQTNNSMINGAFLSKWVKMEIDYSKAISKQIYCLDFCGGNTQFKNIDFDISDNCFSLSNNEAEKLRT